ncbi:hypothetical protein [Diaphorobacter sp.]|uniref:hypothetical protein n=1 Tax=Diaphorobacter sp. TaxID=1934310 RepID=UPI0028B0D41F|nr:hypothetical protein [Diaphorobacter sp.]
MAQQGAQARENFSLIAYENNYHWHLFYQNQSIMLFLGCLTILLASAFLCLSAPRFDGPLQGRRGIALASVFLAAGVWALVQRGLGTAEALASALGLLILALPLASWRLNLRRQRLSDKERS